MRFFNLIVIATLIGFLGCSQGSNRDNNNVSERIDLPYSKDAVNRSEILQIAKAAIDKSFDNVSKGIKDPKFPDSPGPMNFVFPKTRVHDYSDIVGYTQGESNSRVVTFLIGPKNAKGVHLAVEVDVKSKKAIKVYNYPGS